jgi:enoyl-CoA hydratase/carnithine racemase
MLQSRVLALVIDLELVTAWIEDTIARLAEPADVIVLRGRPGAFCNGLPLDGAGSLDAPDGVRALAALLQRLDGDPRPVISVVEGEARGGGVGLAAVADVVIATPGARFQLPEVYLGLVPAAVLPYVARRMGPAMARRMALGQAPLAAHEACSRGLVDVVTDAPDDELSAQVARWSRAEPGAVAAVRRLSAGGWDPERALDAFGELWRGAAQGRIRRFADGETPWEQQ